MYLQINEVVREMVDERRKGGKEERRKGGKRTWSAGRSEADSSAVADSAMSMGSLLFRGLREVSSVQPEKRFESRFSKSIVRWMANSRSFTSICDDRRTIRRPSSSLHSIHQVLYRAHWKTYTCIELRLWKMV